MFSPMTPDLRFRDVYTPGVVLAACAQVNHPVSRENATLLHNPQGLLQLLPFLNNSDR